MREFKLPDPGEGLLEAEIVSWRVKVGDTVAVNDILLEIETAKSLVELPSPFAGVVAAVLVAEGETVEVGTPIIRIEDGVAAPVEPASGEPMVEPVETRARCRTSQSPAMCRTTWARSRSRQARPAMRQSGSMLVGYGAKAGSITPAAAAGHRHRVGPGAHHRPGARVLRHRDAGLPAHRRRHPVRAAVGQPVG